MLYIIDRMLIKLTKRNKLCKIKQDMNYVLMIKSENILAALMIFLTQWKTFMKNQRDNLQNCDC